MQLKDEVSAHISKPGEHFFLSDVDGTLKWTHHKHYQHTFNPLLPALLLQSQHLLKIGVATDQSGIEMTVFNDRLHEEFSQKEILFNGYSVLEGGHVVVKPGQSVLTGGEILTSSESLAEIEQIYEMVVQALGIYTHTEWALVAGLTTEIALPLAEEQCLGSKSIWENGLDVHNQNYKGEYEEVMAWLHGLVVESGLLVHAALSESGNGTLRIIQRGITKATPLEQLHQQKNINLANTIYMGDQMNDLTAARLVREHGGLVAVPANAHPELKKIASVVTHGSASDGVVDVLSSL